MTATPIIPTMGGLLIGFILLVWELGQWYPGLKPLQPLPSPTGPPSRKRKTPVHSPARPQQPSTTHRQLD